MPDFDKENIVELKEFLKGLENYQRVTMYDDGLGDGLCSIVAVHNTNLGNGKSLGGTRICNYQRKRCVIQSLADVLRLSEGMTYKSAAADLKLGGGKGIIITNEKTKERLELYAQFVDSFNGEFITGEDSGIDENDVEIMNTKTKWVVGHVNPSPTTAHGVFEAIKVGVEEFYNGKKQIGDLVIAIPGAAGAVGSSLVRMLAETGCGLVVSDINKEGVAKIAKDYDAEIYGSDDWSVYCDVMAPCLTPGANFNPETIPQLQCKIIAGSTNNQLADRARDGQALHDRGIFYIVDWAANMGGLTMVASELPRVDPSFADYNYDQEGAKERTSKYVTAWTRKLYKLSRDQNKPTAKLADELAEEIWRDGAPIREVLSYGTRKTRCTRDRELREYGFLR